MIIQNKFDDVYAIGIDVGGSSLKCGLVSADGKCAFSFLLPLKKGAQEKEVIDLLLSAIQKCAAFTHHKILGVGIGFPGIVDDEIIVGGADNLEGFVNLNLAKLIKEETSFDVVIDNDANMMGWGETLYGAGAGFTDVVFLTIGTGIGGSLILNGQMYGGYKNRGAELGHLIVEMNGKVCSCGGIGCWEAYGSVDALIKEYALLRNHCDPEMNGKKIIADYLDNDSFAVELMEKHFDIQAVGITSLIHIFSPQKVILGGGITECGDFYVKEIQKRVKKRAMPDAMFNASIVNAKLGNQAGLLGCAGRVFSELGA